MTLFRNRDKVMTGYSIEEVPKVTYEVRIYLSRYICGYIKLLI